MQVREELHIDLNRHLVWKDQKIYTSVSVQLHYLRLPKDIKDYHIFLMDATVATGAAAMMAIRVLLDHDVPEENITLCSLLMAESGEYV